MKKKSLALLVKECYPQALCKLRPTGAKYYQVFDGERYLGQGKTKRQAWAAAYKNMNY